MGVIQATFSFDTDKQSLNEVERNGKSLGERLKSNFRSIFSGGQSIGTAGAKESLNDLERHSKTVSQRIAGYFRRDVEKRAELAFVGAARAAAAGDFPGAIEVLTHRISHLGLIIGTSLGVGAILFKQFYDSVVETKIAYGDLEGELKKPIQGLGIQDLNANLSQLDAKIAEFAKKHSSIWQRLFGGQETVKVTEPTAKTQTTAAGQIVSPGELPSPKEPDLQKAVDELQAAFEKQRKLRQQIAEKESQAVDIKEKGLKVSEGQAELDKNAVALEEKKAKILSETAERREALEKQLRDDDAKRLKGLSGMPTEFRKAFEEEIKSIDEADAARIVSAQRDAQLNEEKIKQERDLKRATSETKSKQLSEALSGQTQEEAHRRVLIDQLRLLEQQLRTSQQLTGEKRNQLQADAAATRVEIRKQQTNNFFNPFSTFQDLTAGIQGRQSQRFMVNRIREQLMKDAGMGQVKPNYKAETEKDLEEWKKGEADRAERMKYGGLTAKEAYDSLTPEEQQGVPSPYPSPARPAGPPPLPPGFSINMNTGQLFDAKGNKIPNLPASTPNPVTPSDVSRPPEQNKQPQMDLKDLPDKVAAAVSNVMREVWQQA